MILISVLIPVQTTKPNRRKQSMNSLLIKNTSAVITCDSKDTVMEHANILINNGVISYIGRSTDRRRNAGCIRISRLSGLINTHHHLYQTFSRNLPQVQNMELFDWLTTLYEIWKNLDQDVIYHSSITGMGELLKTGCTTCFDHHYVFRTEIPMHFWMHSFPPQKTSAFVCTLHGAVWI